MVTNEEGIFTKPCETENLVGFFSTTKRRILLILKKHGEMELKTLSDTLKISKMGVLKHVKDLEQLGLIRRQNKNIGVGRPRLVLTLTNDAKMLFPTAYRTLALVAFEVIEESLGTNGIKKTLETYYNQTYERYKYDLAEVPFDERVHEFSKLRDQDGYMVELIPIEKGVYEFRQYNCPLQLISKKYSEACKLEVEMLRKLLKAEIKKIPCEKTEREHVCRFIIKKMIKH